VEAFRAALGEVAMRFLRGESNPELPSWTVVQRRVSDVVEALRAVF
jgi:hypothetical protein